MTPLPTRTSLPSIRLRETDWQTLVPAEVLALLQEKLKAAKAQIQALTEQPSAPTWENFMIPLEAIQAELSELWSPVSHLHAVAYSPSLNEVYDAGTLLLLTFSTWLETYHPLYDRLKQLQTQSTEFADAPAKRMALKQWIEGLEHNGVHLPPTAQQTLAKIDEALMQAQNTFGKNVIEATNAARIWIESDSLLAGIPTPLVVSMKKNRSPPQDKDQSTGWYLAINQPHYKNVMEYATSRSLRQAVHYLYHTRASELQGIQWDNGPLLGEILRLRQAKADLLGYPNYASYALKPRMLKSLSAVKQFQEQLQVGLKAQAEVEWQALVDFATGLGAPLPLEAWDIAYYTRLHLQSQLGVDDEMLRDYFPVSRVLKGLWDHLHALFGITAKPKRVTAWHNSVLYFELFDEAEQCMGGLYCDLFVRPNKQSGAWMNQHSGVRVWETKEPLQRPIAYVTANFLAPAADQRWEDVCLNHQEMTTLFHEMGHALQLLLTQVTIPSVSGLGGIPWDGIEVASQLLEEWAWDPALLRTLSAHRETGEPIPEPLLQGLLARRNAYAALGLQRQLLLGQFDLMLHQTTPTFDKEGILHCWQVLKQDSVGIPEPEYIRFPHVFLHLFDGGYAAGYYSYLWSELLAVNLFSLFTKDPVSDGAVGRRLRETLYGQGGSVEPMAQFRQLYGQDPQIQHLLSARGIPIPAQVGG